jgi:hypothetical protein
MDRRGDTMIYVSLGSFKEPLAYVYYYYYYYYIKYSEICEWPRAVRHTFAPRREQGSLSLGHSV